jgi:putative NADPH-quinone reductase
VTGESARRIVLIQGHPDGAGGHYCHALAEAYARAARQAGHEVSLLDVGRMSFPMLRGRADQRAAPPPDISAAQASLIRAGHVVLVFPVWNGGPPALTRGFLEQVFRPTFVFPDAPPGVPLGFSSFFTNRKGLTGRSARIIATMQMPGLVYRCTFHPRGERNHFSMAGLAPIRETFIGGVESLTAARRAEWLTKVAALGQAAR